MSTIRFIVWGATAAAVVTLAATAAGADGPLSIKDDQYGRPLIWSGAYVGAHLGGRWGDYRVLADSGGITTPASLDPTSVIGGFQIGYNIPAGHVVLGVEADVSFGHARDSIADELAARVKLGTQGSLTARVGVPMGQIMPYLKGGLAWTRASVYGDILSHGPPPLAETGSDTTQASETLVGWTVGGGLEYALRSQWTARVEYLFADYRSFTTTSRTGDSFRHDVDTHSVRFGLNYKLGN